MAKSQESFNKKEKEKKRRKKQQEKRERREARKIEREEVGTVPFEDLIRYVDEDGNLTDTKPDPAKKRKIKVEDIIIGATPVDNTPVERVRKGTVKFFNDDKGFGFIIDEATKDSVFVHINNLSDPIRENDRVIFEIEMGPKGLNAIKVELVK